MGVIGDTLSGIIKGTRNLVLLVAGSLALTFVAGMFYGVAFSNQNTFWWPIYILVFILILKVINELTPPKK